MAFSMAFSMAFISRNHASLLEVDDENCRRTTSLTEWSTRFCGSSLLLFAGFSRTIKTDCRKAKVHMGMVSSLGWRRISVLPRITNGAATMTTVQLGIGKRFAFPSPLLNVLPRKWKVPNCFATIERASLGLKTVRSVRLRPGFGVIESWLSLTEGAHV